MKFLLVLLIQAQMTRHITRLFHLFKNSRSLKGEIET